MQAKTFRLALIFTAIILVLAFIGGNWSNSQAQSTIPTKRPPVQEEEDEEPIPTATAKPRVRVIVPTFSIVEVVTDEKVTIRTFNYPAGQTFTVRMGDYGTLGIGGIVSGTFDSGLGGSFLVTIDIPPELRGKERIAIRADSPRGYFSYNWFWNKVVTGVGAGGTSKSGTGGYNGIPTFKIIVVEKNKTVTICTNNFPPNQDFTVRMGEYGTKAIGGTVVDKTNSGKGGTFKATYNIPDGFSGRKRIAIRMDSPQGYYAFNWFWNNTADVSKGSPCGESEKPASQEGSSSEQKPATSGTGGYTGIPTFSIAAVTRDNSVTVSTKNYPPNQTFSVRMGEYGTRGVGGVVVGTFESNSGGNATASFSIPASLAGRQRIAIRMDSSQGYYAFNWFWNNTTK